MLLSTMTHKQQSNFLKQKKQKKVIKIFENVKSHPLATKHQDITSLIIQPVQRIPRYVLLLVDLKINTPEDHPDYNFVDKSLEAMRKVAYQMDITIKQAESREIVIKIQELFAPYFDSKSLPLTTIVEAHRFFIREMVLLGEYRLYLFNDLAIYFRTSKNRVHPEATFYLEKIVVTDIDDKSFQIEMDKEHYKLIAQNSKDKKEFMTSFTETIDLHKARFEEMLRRGAQPRPLSVC